METDLLKNQLPLWIISAINHHPNSLNRESEYRAH